MPEANEQECDYRYHQKTTNRRTREQTETWSWWSRDWHGHPNSNKTLNRQVQETNNTDRNWPGIQSFGTLWQKTGGQMFKRTTADSRIRYLTSNYYWRQPFFTEPWLREEGPLQWIMHNDNKRIAGWAFDAFQVGLCKASKNKAFKRWMSRFVCVCVLNPFDWIWEDFEDQGHICHHILMVTSWIEN